MGVAIVTGAARGIGKAIAVALAEEGRTMLVTDLRADGLSDTVAAIEGLGGIVSVVAGDVRDRDHAAEVSRVAESLGPVELLVNNAGIAGMPPREFVEADVDEWWEVIDINLRGSVLMTHAVLPRMLARGRGRVVNLNSLLGSWGIPKMSPYSVSKAGLMRLSSCLTDEYSDRGLAFFDLSPGNVKTILSDATLPLVSQAAATPFVGPEVAAKAVVALDSGRYDALSGRFLKSSEDLDALVEVVSTTPRARQLRVLPVSDGDLP